MNYRIRSAASDDSQQIAVLVEQLGYRADGRRLVAEAEEFAWNNGCARIEITSGDHRPDAHAFYEAIGYFQDSRRFVKKRPA